MCGSGSGFVMGVWGRGDGSAAQRGRRVIDLFGEWVRFNKKMGFEDLE